MSGGSGHGDWDLPVGSVPTVVRSHNHFSHDYEWCTNQDFAGVSSNSTEVYSGSARHVFKPKENHLSTAVGKDLVTTLIRPSLDNISHGSLKWAVALAAATASALVKPRHEAG